MIVTGFLLDYSQSWARYFDGCNTCSLQKEDPYYDGRMGCTYMYCEMPSEPKCLKYIGETEKN